LPGCLSGKAWISGGGRHPDSPSGTEVNRRIWLGHGKDGAATLALHDAAGHKRLLLQVAADGKTRITVLDIDGKPIKELLPDS
jgi:hypothetical protein